MRLEIFLNLIIVGANRENESGSNRSLEPDINRTEAYWERRNIPDHLLLKRARPFGFSRTRQTRNNPDSFVCCLEVRVQNHQFDILVPHPSAVYELSQSILTLFHSSGLEENKNWLQKAKKGEG